MSNVNFPRLVMRLYEGETLSEGSRVLIYCKKQSDKTLVWRIVDEQFLKMVSKNNHGMLYTILKE